LEIATMLDTPDVFTFVAPLAPTHLTPEEIAGFVVPLPDLGGASFNPSAGWDGDAGAAFDVPMAYYSNEGAGMIPVEAWGMYLSLAPEVDWAGLYTLMPIH